MSDSETRRAVEKAYKIQYPEWKSISVGSIVRNISGGSLAVVAAIDEDKVEIEEVCFIDANGRVRIFEATSELIGYLEYIGSFRQWIFSGQGVSAIAFLGTLAAVVALASIGDVSKNPGFDVLKQVLLLAAGFFFANQSSAKSR